MKVYTKRGDAGETDLAGGGRVSKDDLQVEAYGTVDELNAAVGVAAAICIEDNKRLLETIQRILFQIGAALSTNREADKKALPTTGAITEDVELLEAAIDGAEKELAPLRAFVLPGGTPAAAAFHVARTVCRRAERRVVSLAREMALDDATVKYLNRLSDLMFVLARLENARAGTPDVKWTSRDG
jgi:cob(I)alamin adenosyltransferase